MQIKIKLVLKLFKGKKITVHRVIFAPCFFSMLVLNLSSDSGGERGENKTVVNISPKTVIYLRLIMISIEIDEQKK